MAVQTELLDDEVVLKWMIMMLIMVMLIAHGDDQHFKILQISRMYPCKNWTIMVVSG